MQRAIRVSLQLQSHSKRLASPQKQRIDAADWPRTRWRRKEYESWTWLCDEFSGLQRIPLFVLKHPIYIYELHVSKEVKSVMLGLSENGYPKISWLIIIFSVLAILGYPRLFDKPVCFQCIRQLFVHDSCWRAKKRMAKSLAFMATDCFDRPACKLMGMLRIALG